MGSDLRRFLPLGIAIAFVLSLGATSVLAQDPVTPAAGINADKVDGRSAIKYTSNPAQRKGKLVAFGGSGYLPNNAILKADDADKLDGQDSAAFATFAALKNPAGAVNEADNLVSWNQLLNVPLPIADGVDSEGVTSVRVLTRTSAPVNIVNGGQATVDVDCPTGFIATGGGYFASGYIDMIVWQSRAIDADTWRVSGFNDLTYAGDTTLTGQVFCIRAEPAGIVTAAKNSDYGPKNLKKGRPR